MDVVNAGQYTITIINPADNQSVDQCYSSISRHDATDCTQLPQPVETATSKESDVVRKCQLLVDDDTKTCNNTEQLDIRSTDSEGRTRILKSPATTARRLLEQPRDQ